MYGSVYKKGKLVKRTKMKIEEVTSVNEFGAEEKNKVWVGYFNKVRVFEEEVWKGVNLMFVGSTKVGKVRSKKFN